MLAFSSCQNEQQKNLLSEDAINGSVSEIYSNAVAPLYDYMDKDSLETSDADPLYHIWDNIYQGISLANHSLDFIDAKASLITADQKDRLKAEVRAIRALLYYEAMDLFGRIPVVLSSEESAIYASAKSDSIASFTDVYLSAQSERSEVFQFIFSELQQVLPYLSAQHSGKEGRFSGRITKPVVNYLLAKMALNAEIYTFDDWTKGYKKRPRGRNIDFMVQTADGASLLNDLKASENRSKKLNAWETCIYYCDALAAEGYSLDEDVIFCSTGTPVARFLFRYTDVLLMKSEANIRNGEDGRTELNMVRARQGKPAHRATLNRILEERLDVLSREDIHRQDLIRFGMFTDAFNLYPYLKGKSSGYITVFPIPQKCIDLNPKLVQNKGYEVEGSSAYKTMRYD
uniref:RagB/SusD family nutrient uptake outer membrane protein n=1 Tax=Prevotella sp. TaxID=59823 RepID=UPI003FF00B17